MPRRRRPNGLTDREERAAAAVQRHCPEGRVLDFPAGRGYLSRHLRELGYDVVAADVNPDAFRVEGIPCIAMNLDRTFELEDEAFDAACCVAGMEHSENPYDVAREFRRVLRPGGLLVLCVPNFSALLRRIRYMLWGRCQRHSLPLTHDGEEKTNSGHTSCLPVEQFEHVLATTRFEVLERRFFRPNAKTGFWTFPLWGPTAALAWLAGKAGGRRRFAEAWRPEVLLHGEVLFVARKTAQPAAPAGPPDRADACLRRV